MRTSSHGARKRVLVVGNGMVGHRFVEATVERGLLAQYELVVVGEEPRRAYDRVHLSSMFDGVDRDTLALGTAELYARDGVTLRCGEQIVQLDPAASHAHTARGETLPFDICILATGSSPFVPPVPGADARGVFVYRTIDDLDAIREWAAECGNGAVIGGGLLGLEAANAFRLLGLETTVVELAPRLMSAQLDTQGSEILRTRVEELDVRVRTGIAVRDVRVDADGKVVGLTFAAGDAVEHMEADIVVFAAGIRPRDELARACGLPVGERGGVIVDDMCRTAAANVYAIGEVACHRGRVYGLVGPGNAMANVVADRLAGGNATFEGGDTSTTLKLLGVDVACVGDPRASGTDIVFGDLARGVWQKVVVDGERVLGAVLVGDVKPFGRLAHAARTGTPMPDVAATLVPAGPGDPSNVADIANEATLCACHNVTAGRIRAAVRSGHAGVGSVKQATKAGTGCGSCVTLLTEVVDGEIVAAGGEPDRSLCPHFAMRRPELFEGIRASGARTFGEIVGRFGTGTGCEVCKPAVASILASLEPGYILEGERASLQDTNDHFLANLQRNGTYSVVPRVPGGEITPEKLISLGEVARDFDLYTKITGGQRIDLFGARVEQLPAIWRRLIAAGFESGHAYGKAVRTVKSCVGSTWCRYGVQDSVQLAIELELRYRGLRAPHKIKLAVSGCARECAEAQGKDVGVIATEHGWNLYVGGNGGMRPAHAELLAESIDAGTLVRYIDRYLMWYVRTADRLERTATWQRKLPGGIDFVRRIVVDDELGLAAELEADMERHVANYRCEWRETVEDPERAARFVAFVNSPDPDPTIVETRVRGQRIPVAVI
jgi:nitrite reductase (NADH) large subunit